MKHFFDTRLVKRILLASVPALCLAGAAQAASISYYLDQSDNVALPDGNNYLKVTIADGVDGAIDFTITPEAALLAQTGGHFGIRAFAFSSNAGFFLDDTHIVGLPASYIVRTPVGVRAMDGFGKLETKVRLLGPGAWNSDLTFSIVGVAGDIPSDYVENSLLPALEGQVPFAARIEYLLDTPYCTEDMMWCTDYGLAYVGGGSPVPVPAAAWMFLTGFAGLAARARRRMAA